jgi:hypothetical protein
MHKLPRTLLILKKRTDTLRTLLRQAASDYQLNKAAGKVRDARIQVLRAKIGEIPSVLLTAQQERRIQTLYEQIEALRASSPLEILSEFRRTLPNAPEAS